MYCRRIQSCCHYVRDHTDPVSHDNWHNLVKMPRFQCRSPLKILGLSVDGKTVKISCVIILFNRFFNCFHIIAELARRKVAYHNWQNERNCAQTESKTNEEFSRYQSNRRRRLLKEQQLEDKRRLSQEKEESKKTSGMEGDRCSKCQQRFSPPYQVYVCQHNHLHKERNSNHVQNKEIQVTISDLIIFQVKISCVAVLLFMFWALKM